DNYLRLLAQKFGVDLKGRRMGELSKAEIEAIPAEPRKYTTALRAEYDAVFAAQAASRPGHVEDCLRFASRAWRRPLSEKEKQSLRSFYDKTISSELDHSKA